MKTDLYTKAVLTVIAVMLSVIAGKQIINATPTVKAAEEYGGFARDTNGNFYVYNPSTYNVAVYDMKGVWQKTVPLLQLH